MTWNTPLGHRILQGSERRIILDATNAMECEVIHDIDDSLAVGIKVFDSMTGCQQLVMLDYVRHHLLEETSQSAGMTAVIEGTAGAIVAYIMGQIDYELDCEKERQSDSSFPKAPRIWRKRILRLVKEFKWQLRPLRNEADWDLAIESFYDRILHDDDFEMDFTDGDPDASRRVNESLGIPESYFSTIPLSEPDGPEMLELIRRLVV